MVGGRLVMPLLALALVPLLAHAPELVGWVSSNPAYIVSGLGVLPHGSPLPALPGWIDPNAGFTIQALGGRAAADWLGGRVPWWNPYTGVGMPLAAESQDAAMFLPFTLLLRWFDGVLYLRIAMQAIAGFATWALLRTLGASRAAAFVGGALMALGGTFAWFAHGPILPIAFLPLFLLGIERAAAAASRGEPGGWAWVTAAVGWSLLSGFPETAYIDGLLALVWALLRLLRLGRARGRLADKLALGGGAGLLVAAPLVVPFADVLRFSFIGVHDSVAHFAMQPFGHALLLVPYLYGPLNGFGHAEYGYVGGYVGLPAVLLAVLALCGGRTQRPLRWMLAAWVVVTYAKAAGVPVLTEAMNVVPLVGQSMFARLVQPSWQMATAVLAALAIDDWRSGEAPGWRRPAAALGVLGGLLAVALWLGWPTVAAILPRHRTYPWILAASLVWAAASGVGLAFLCAGPPSTRRVAGLVGLVCADALAMFLAPLAVAPADARLDSTPVAFMQAHLGLQRFYTLGPFAPNYGALFATASINHNTLPTPRDWVDHVRAALDPDVDDVSFVGGVPPGPGRAEALRRNRAAFAELGVRYVVSLPGERPLGDNVAPVFISPTVAISEIPEAAPYWEARGAACKLTPAGREDLRARCDAPATLVRRELFFPGWRARVDGRAVRLDRASPLFQSVTLPAGESVVAFRYEPPYATAAWGACGLGIAILLGGLIRARRVDRVRGRA